MNIKLKLSTLVASALFSISTMADPGPTPPPTVVCWDVTCVICDGETGECGPVFRAPDEICNVQGVACPT